MKKMKKMKKNNNSNLTKYFVALAVFAGTMSQPAWTMINAGDSTNNPKNQSVPAAMHTTDTTAARNEVVPSATTASSSSSATVTQTPSMHKIRIIDTKASDAKTPIQLIFIPKINQGISRQEYIEHQYRYMAMVLGLNPANDIRARAVCVEKFCEQIKHTQAIEKIPFNDPRSTFNQLLHYAATINNEPRYGAVDDNSVIILALQRAGVPIDCKDATGQTALHTAAQYRSMQTIKYLLTLGASPTTTDNNGRTPQQIVLLRN